MQQTPQAAALLINHASVVCFDAPGTIINDGAIAITGNSISWIGESAAAGRAVAAKDTLDASGLIATPGLTDAHYHTGQQLLRGKLAAIHRKGPSKNPHWKNYYVPFESGLTPDDVYYSGIVGYTSMISVGTTSFLEAGGPHPDAMGRAADEVGIRGRIAMSTLDMDDSLPASYRQTTDQALRENEALVGRWRRHPRVNGWLALRQIIANTETLRIEMMKLAKSLDTPIHTHHSEGTYEIEFTEETFGARPPAYFDRIGMMNDHLHVAHSPLLTLDEVNLYARTGVSVAHCPFGNYGVAPHRMNDMVRRNIPVALGTDGAGSRCTLDLFEAMHQAVVGQTAVAGTLYHSGIPIDYDRMLELAARNGARAMRMPDKLGSLEVGKLADIILVGSTDYDQFPVLDPAITLSQNAVGRDVRTVIVDGRVVMKDRQFLTVDLEPMKRRIADQYGQIMERYHTALARNNTPY